MTGIEQSFKLSVIVFDNFLVFLAKALVGTEDIILVSKTLKGRMEGAEDEFSRLSTTSTGSSPSRRPRETPHCVGHDGTTWPGRDRHGDSVCREFCLALTGNVGEKRV